MHTLRIHRSPWNIQAQCECGRLIGSFSPDTTHREAADLLSSFSELHRSHVRLSYLSYLLTFGSIACRHGPRARHFSPFQTSPVSKPTPQSQNCLKTYF